MMGERVVIFPTLTVHGSFLNALTRILLLSGSLSMGAGDQESPLDPVRSAETGSVFLRNVLPTFLPFGTLK